MCSCYLSIVRPCSCTSRAAEVAACGQLAASLLRVSAPPMRRKSRTTCPALNKSILHRSNLIVKRNFIFFQFFFWAPHCCARHFLCRRNREHVRSTLVFVCLAPREHTHFPCVGNWSLPPMLLYRCQREKSTQSLSPPSIKSILRGQDLNVKRKIKIFQIFFSAKKNRARSRKAHADLHTILHTKKDTFSALLADFRTFSQAESRVVTGF